MEGAAGARVVAVGAVAAAVAAGAGLGGGWAAGARVVAVGAGETVASWWMFHAQLAGAAPKNCGMTKRQTRAANTARAAAKQETQAASAEASAAPAGSSELDSLAQTVTVEC